VILPEPSAAVWQDERDQDSMRLRKSTLIVVKI
jgi:hypothetical protein